MLLDTSKKGLTSVFQEWQLAVLDLLSKGQEKCSREAWIHVNDNSEWGKQEGNTISRASVINFLNYLAKDEELLAYREETCKGGSRGIYRMATDRRKFVKLIMERFVEKLNEISELENIGCVLSLLEPVKTEL